MVDQTFGSTGGVAKSRFLIRGTATIALLFTAACGSIGSNDTMPEWQQQTAYYSDASEITASNADELGLVWEFRDFVVRGRTHRGVSATPIVVDDIMYVTGPWSVVYAIEAKTGQLKWQYDPEVDGNFARRTCCDVVNRGVAVSDGVVYSATLDGYLVALDGKTGAVIWKTDTITDRSRSYAITGAPRVAGDNVVIGNGGAEMGVRGYASAFDRKTGKLAWRFYTVPGAGPDEHPEITEARKTWSKSARWDLGGGGTVWDSIVYDPETNIVFLGTGNGMPHPAWSRSPGGGDNLFLSSIVAINADTGRKVWHYQTTPQDSWDYTATQNMVLADIELGGRMRQVIMQAPKNGFFYVLDRKTGELLSAEKYTKVTWAERVDLKTGRPVFAEAANYSQGTKLVWPSQAGGHNWQPMAYNAKTGLVYIPVLQSPMLFTTYAQPYQPYSVLQGVMGVFPGFGAFHGADSGASKAKNPDPEKRFDAALVAWDPVKGKIAWTSSELPFWSGGVMTTATGLVIQGSADGYLNIYDGENGKVLHRINVGTGIMAAPMSFTLDGEQYIAVTAGFGGAMNVAFTPGSAATKRENFERLLVFRLGAKKAPELPPLRIATPFVPAPAKFRGDPASVQRGQQLYPVNCGRCHGAKDGLGGYPNLWKMAPETHEAFNSIVLDGAFSYAGMASFSDVLSAQDVRDIHAYLAEPE